MNNKEILPIYTVFYETEFYDEYISSRMDVGATSLQHACERVAEILKANNAQDENREGDFHILSLKAVPESTI